jgi:hypothetical protein
VAEEEAEAEEAEERRRRWGKRRWRKELVLPDLLTWDLLDLLDRKDHTLIWIRRNIPLTGTGKHYAYFRVMYWGHCYRSYSTPA